jgi:hypothetical protein
LNVDPDSALWAAIVIVHAGATWFLVGLIWTIQLVHYPTFSSVDPVIYNSFQKRHMHRMGQLIGLPWLVEGICVLALFLLAPDDQIRLLATLGGILELVVIGITVRSSIPAHETLSDGFDEAAHHRLLRSNWWRCGAWTARGIIALIMLDSIRGN